MEIDKKVTARLSQLEQITFEGPAFRVTGKSINPVAPSINGGRWAPRPNNEPGFPVLYTSLEKDGALAEVVSYLALQSPLPSKPLVVHELAVTTSKTIRLVVGELGELGVDPTKYGERNYRQTQMIGAAINYMGLDGLISPSARWDCENLTLFMDHHAFEEKLKPIAAEEVDWQDWMKRKGLMEKK